MSSTVPIAVRRHWSHPGVNEGGVLPAATERLYLALEKDARTAIQFAGCDYLVNPSCHLWTRVPEKLPRVRIVSAAITKTWPQQELPARQRDSPAGSVDLLSEEPVALHLRVHRREDCGLVVADTY